MRGGRKENISASMDILKLRRTWLGEHPPRCDGRVFPRLPSTFQPCLRPSSLGSLRESPTKMNRRAAPRLGFSSPCKRNAIVEFLEVLQGGSLSQSKSLEKRPSSASAAERVEQAGGDGVQPTDNAAVANLLVARVGFHWDALSVSDEPDESLPYTRVLSGMRVNLGTTTTPSRIMP